MKSKSKPISTPRPAPRAAPKKGKARYRMLEDGEKKRKGDTFKDFDGRWKPIVFAGQRYSNVFDEPIRRPVSPKGSAKPAGRSRPKASPKPQSPRGRKQAK